jgi:hypothetical protein
MAVWKVLSYIGFAGSAINLAAQIQAWSKLGTVPSLADAQAAVDPVLVSFSSSFGVQVPMDKADKALAAVIAILAE